MQPTTSARRSTDREPSGNRPVPVIEPDWNNAGTHWCIAENRCPPHACAQPASDVDADRHGPKTEGKGTCGRPCCPSALHDRRSCTTRPSTERPPQSTDRPPCY